MADPTPAELLLKNKMRAMQDWPEIYFSRLHEFERHWFYLGIVAVICIASMIFSRIFHGSSDGDWTWLVVPFLVAPIGGYWFKLTKTRKEIQRTKAELEEIGYRVGVDVSNSPTKIVMYQGKPKDDVIELSPFSQIDWKEFTKMLEYEGDRFVRWYRHQKLKGR
jgi:hypothetical protein